MVITYTVSACFFSLSPASYGINKPPRKSVNYFSTLNITYYIIRLADTYSLDFLKEITTHYWLNVPIFGRKLFLRRGELSDIFFQLPLENERKYCSFLTIDSCDLLK